MKTGPHPFEVTVNEGEGFQNTFVKKFEPKYLSGRKTKVMTP